MVLFLGLLSMECAPEPEVVRPQKGCGNLSYYSKMAKGGGHKGKCIFFLDYAHMHSFSQNCSVLFKISLERTESVLFR